MNTGHEDGFCRTFRTCGRGSGELCACARKTRNISLSASNSNCKPRTKPKKVVRRDPLEAAERFAARFKESMKILS